MSKETYPTGRLNLLTDREKELYAQLPSAVKAKINHTKMFCKKCEKVCGINSMGLCRDCKTFKCKRCGKTMAGTTGKMFYCRTCLTRNNSLERGELFGG